MVIGDVNAPIDHSKKMAKALKRKKEPVEFIEYGDVEHSFRCNGYRVDMLDRIGSFLDAHIGQPTADPERARRSSGDSGRP